MKISRKKLPNNKKFPKNKFSEKKFSKKIFPEQDNLQNLIFLKKRFHKQKNSFKKKTFYFL